MYVHTRTLGWLARRGILAQPRSARRGLYAVGFGLTASLLAGTVSVARWLDGLVYPDFKRAPAPAPLFVLATPRSGTTYLHHLLSLDEERFATCKLYQTLAPSILLERESTRSADSRDRSGACSTGSSTPSTAACSPTGTASIA